jgi:alpha-L-fucosidase
MDTDVNWDWQFVRNWFIENKDADMKNSNIDFKLIKRCIEQEYIIEKEIYKLWLFVKKWFKFNESIFKIQPEYGFIDLIGRPCITLKLLKYIISEYKINYSIRYVLQQFAAYKYIESYIEKSSGKKRYSIVKRVSSTKIMRVIILNFKLEEL